MKQSRWQITLAITLMAIASLLYLLQIAIFHAERDTFFYLFQDLAFVPVQVLLVTIIVDRFLRIRERMALLKKLNMVIGAFFSEVGTKLLKHFVVFDTDSDTITGKLVVTGVWTDQRFDDAIRDLKAHQVHMVCTRGDLAVLKQFLSERRGFLLGLLENQNLLEHETFTDLLWAVFHLVEELDSRPDVRSLARPDCEHIAGDIKRAYLILIVEWLSYLRHLKNQYPYLFSLAVRTNPFDPKASVEIK
jgi:hypothetical protein